MVEYLLSAGKTQGLVLNIMRMGVKGTKTPLDFTLTTFIRKSLFSRTKRTVYCGEVGTHVSVLIYMLNWTKAKFLNDEEMEVLKMLQWENSVKSVRGKMDSCRVMKGSCF